MRQLKSTFMILLIVFSIMTVLSISIRPVLADTSILYEYYNKNDDDSVGPIGGPVWEAQTFTIGTDAHTIDYVKLKLLKVGIPGTVTVGIRSTDVNGHPTGSDLASGTIDGNSLTTDSSGAWYQINMSTEISFSSNTKYAIVVRAPNGDILLNYVKIRADVSSPSYDGGNRESSSDSGSSWTSDSTKDCLFEIYGAKEELIFDFWGEVSALSGYLSDHHPSNSAYTSAHGSDFYVQNSFYIKHVTVRLAKTGSPTVNLTMNVYALATQGYSGLPTGNPLVTSDAINASTLGASYLSYNFTFSTPYVLDAGTYYGIAIQAGLEGVINDSNRVYMRFYNTTNSAYTVTQYLNSEWILDTLASECTLRMLIYGVYAYELSIDSLPTSVSFTLNGTSKTTPYSEIFNNGSYVYQINFTESFTRAGLTWTFAYWNDNTSLTNPNRTINLQSDTNLSVTYTSAYAPIEYTGYEPVFECAMNNMFELNGILEGNDTYRQMLFDSSPYENHGKIYPLTHPYAGPTMTWGYMGKALQFDGVDDSVIIDSDVSLNISEALTVEFWFSPTNSTPNQVLLSKATTSSSGEWYIGIQNSQIYTKLWTTSGNAYTGTITDSNLTDGIFVYVALTYDYRDGYYTIWLHGTPWLNVTTDGNKIRLLDKNLYLGNLGNSSNWFEGIIDEIRVFPYKRTEGEIYSDARNPIAKFGSTSLVNSGTSSDGDTWTVVEGTTSDYQGFTNNDPALPWAYANNTNPYTFVRTLKYIAGFQQYQLYCTVKFDTNENNTGLIDGNGVYWYWNFFKNGRLQVTYDILVEANSWNSNPPSGVSIWYFRFRRTTPYFATEEMIYAYVTSNRSFNPISLPIIVSAWIGPDNKHFSVRIDFQDERSVTDTHGYIFPFTYSFDLVDENLNPHILDWYDGWVVAGIKTRAQQTASGYWARMEIESHKLGFLGAVIILGVITVAGWLGYQWITTGKNPVTIVTETVKEVVNKLKEVPEIIGTAVKKIGETVVDALSGLAHDLIGAIGGLGQLFGQALKPIADLLLGLGKAFVNAFISFMQPILSAINNLVTFFAKLVESGLNAIGGIFGAPTLGTIIIDFLTELPSMIVAFFTFMLNLLTQLLAVVVGVTSAVASLLLLIGSFLYAIFDGITGLIDMLNVAIVDSGLWELFVGALTLIFICLPFIELVRISESPDGLSLFFDDLNKVINVVSFVIDVTVKIIQIILQVITAILEAIPG